MQGANELSIAVIPGVTVLGAKSATADGYTVSASEVEAFGLTIAGVPDPRVYGASGAYGSNDPPVTDPLERLPRAIRAYLAFFKEHPQFVELLIQERAEFRDRKQSTYFEHRRARAAFWEEVYRGLIRAGRVRDVPVARMLDVSNLGYGDTSKLFPRAPRLEFNEACTLL